MIRLLIAVTSVMVAAPAQESSAPPKLVSKVEPQYSEEARADGIQGTVLLQCAVGEDGVPHDIYVVQTLDPRLDQKAVEAVKQWRFQPAMRNGHAVAWEGVKVELTFRLIQQPEVQKEKSIPTTLESVRQSPLTTPQMILESAEHRFAREKHDKAVKWRADKMAQLHEILDQVDRLQHKRWGFNVDQQDALLSQARTLQDLIKMADPVVEQSRLQLEHADECVKVFQETIDKKASDLTTRETEWITGCKSVDLYPPEK
jgi:TonB family protein